MSLAMSVIYVLAGLFFIVFPYSTVAQNLLPSAKWSYVLGALLIIYGFYRAWRAIQSQKDDDDDEDEEEYRYYSGKKNG